MQGNPEDYHPFGRDLRLSGIIPEISDVRLSLFVATKGGCAVHGKTFEGSLGLVHPWSRSAASRFRRPGASLLDGGGDFVKLLGTQRREEA